MPHRKDKEQTLRIGLREVEDEADDVQYSPFKELPELEQPLKEKQPLPESTMSEEKSTDAEKAEHDPLKGDYQKAFTDGKNSRTKHMYKSAICLFAFLNILLLILNAVAIYYLVNEEAPPEPVTRFCLKCEDIRGHPDDKLEHIVDENDTCCVDDPANLNYLVGYYTERWMKLKVIEENKTFQYCRNENMEPFSPRPSIKLMGLEVPQINPEHKRLLWDSKHEMAIVPGEEDIRYLEKDGQIEIKKSGLYQVYSQVHFEHDRNGDVHKHHPVVFAHWVLLKKVGTIPGDERILMKSTETECKGDNPNVAASSYLGSAFQLEDGDRVYVKVHTKDEVVATPHMNFFGAHML